MARRESGIQLRGHCQCCGRIQAVVSGCMSKHGYRVKEGWFQGVCQGEHYQPLEVSREQADRIVASVRAECAELRERVADLKSGKVRPLLAQSGNKVEDPGRPRWQWDDEMVPFEKAPRHYQAAAREAAIWKAQRRAEIGESFADGLEKLANECYGKPLQEVRADAGPAPIKYGEQRVSPRGVLIMSEQVGGRVYWKDARGYKGWMGSQAWRKLPMAAAVEA